MRKTASGRPRSGRTVPSLYGTHVATRGEWSAEDKVGRACQSSEIASGGPPFVGRMSVGHTQSEALMSMSRLGLVVTILPCLVAAAPARPQVPELGTIQF